MGVFDKKNFNSNVFGQYLTTVPKVKQNAFKNAQIFTVRNDLKTMLDEQTGGNYISVPMVGLLGGDADNYDGSTNITTDSIDTYIQSMIVIGRAKGWKEKDFSFDITGKDFMEEIAGQVAGYYDDVDQADILAILEGIYKVNEDGFAYKHTYDISGANDNKVGATTLNSAIQKASGANKNIFKLCIMHSEVATNLENLQVLAYWKETDANGVQRDVSLANWNGRVVLIDDEVPTERVETTAGVYEFTVGTKAVSGDKVRFGNVTLTAGTDFSLDTDTATGNATAIASALASSSDVTVSGYTWASSSTKIVATEKTAHYGDGIPDCEVTGTVKIVGSVATAPVIDTKFTTYVLGAGAFGYCDVGAKVPSEVDRNPAVNGGEDVLYTRQRKVFAPYGFSFVNSAIVSPTKAQLKSGANWGVVKNTSGEYINTKAIPFVRIISKG